MSFYRSWSQHVWLTISTWPTQSNQTLHHQNETGGVGSAVNFHDSKKISKIRTFSPSLFLYSALFTLSDLIFMNTYPWHHGSHSNPASGTLPNPTEREQPWPSVCLCTDLAIWEDSGRLKDHPYGHQAAFIRPAHVLCGYMALMNVKECLKQYGKMCCLE